ncbi:MAG: 4-diphosphocytidyl-2C-methyl-D-erythritol kinase [Rothia sp.]|uniref:GHMP family kinase ATP-binding protein n=1 Tax=Rothia sp. (in: high G+C Gram-positive bacteria) TaxID=1885016 RepID=UPI001CAB0582|nr:4-diphosphocytidyl-2C-methyl-D-erythritol kinase [Rothia sp. (in: high G+C Gram-positive bacteria)]MBF1680474.1 4-diphosphocytidyl-2C-methyl-D-erythritol kinase [Rothia sp. (in: high G+C Gram-positive bacteria)]
MSTASQTAISVDAPGKVNLYLAVGDVRPDGYHPLTTLFVAVSLTETITVSEGSVPGLSLSMDIVPGSLVDQQMQAGQFNPADVPMDERNLVYRAAELVLREHSVSPAPALHLHIAKAVPVAGGMAGGSADAAAALIATDRYLHATGRTGALLTQTDYERLAAQLGADIPFSVRAALGQTLALGQGTGTELQNVAAPQEPLHLVIVAAQFGLSTPSVFKQLDAGRAAGLYPASGELVEPVELLNALNSYDGSEATLASLAPLLRNDLQAPALSCAPQLEQTLNLRDSEGVYASLVSGSGPTVLLLTSSHAQAEALATSLRVEGHHAVATEVTSA